VAGKSGSVGPQGEKGDKGEKGEKGDVGESPILSAQYPLKLDKERKHLSIDLSKIKSTIGTAPVLYDGGGGLGEAFKFISVSGQSGLTAVQYDKETLTFVAGSNISLTTDPDSNSITINSSGGGIGGGGATGATGERGATGSTGATGERGATGFTGATGATGERGATGATGAGGALGNWGSFWDTNSKTVASTTIAYGITFSNSDASNYGVTVASDGKVSFAQGGIYNLQFSAQLRNTDNAVHDATFWFKKNNSDIPDSAGIVSVPARKDSNNFGYALPSWNIVVPINSGDYVQMYWHASNTSVSMLTFTGGANPTHSRSPAIIFTATQVMYTQVGPTGPTGAIPTDYVSSINSLTGAVGITVDGNLFLSITGANNKTILLSSKPPATVKGQAGTLAFTDTIAPFEGDGFDLGADAALIFNYLSDLALETPGSFKLGTLQGTASYIQFGDGTTQGTAAKCCPPPIASTGASGVASFDNNHFAITSTGHVSVKTGIKAGNIVVLGTSTIFGIGETGALPALDGSNLLEVNAKYLQGKTPKQLTDGGTF
jgi:hypothetical protein